MPRSSRYARSNCSTSTSAVAARRRRLSRPSSVSRSSTTLRLLWLSDRKGMERSGPGWPLANGAWLRRGSPPGGSILMTSAPRSPRIRVANCVVGPPRSRTRRCPSADASDSCWSVMTVAPPQFCPPPIVGVSSRAWGVLSSLGGLWGRVAMRPRDTAMDSGLRRNDGWV